MWESWKKNKVFGLFFTMKPSRLKIMEKFLIFFFFFYGSACCDYVWLPRKCGKVEKKIPIFPTSPARAQDIKSIQFFL